MSDREALIVAIRSTIGRQAEEIENLNDECATLRDELKQQQEVEKLKTDCLANVVEQRDALWAALYRALPILEENAEDESIFWGGTEHHVAKEAVETFEQARAILAGRPMTGDERKATGKFFTDQFGRTELENKETKQ